ncbi:uncharacterized protein MYCFIDRAFT_206929 [Pseudocercospora fijiensis CIRAD86]|uniref:USP domain-containing protein n=1 Tax=Pseudocercospora fijiensis (strain CIRAD86) TaxID=383855 RepID=M2ZA69_PSEFD|nr:uncharacterized protein MYCFIDRAFT_206929 [Pseudocercospora fijiensis CIRAD86]EME86730.1 hypothetical protein MYCFIDRAFT_206929 [Pseudocercospora fijiensis CIRAD86]
MTAVGDEDVTMFINFIIHGSRLAWLGEMVMPSRRHQILGTTEGNRAFAHASEGGGGGGGNTSESGTEFLRQSRNGPHPLTDDRSPSPTSFCFLICFLSSQHHFITSTCYRHRSTFIDTMTSLLGLDGIVHVLDDNGLTQFHLIVVIVPSAKLFLHEQQKSKMSMKRTDLPICSVQPALSFSVSIHIPFPSAHFSSLRVELVSATRLLRSARTQTESDFYAQREAELKAAAIQKSRTKKATKAAQAARIAEAAKSETATQSTSKPVTAGQKCPVCGRSDSPDGDASANSPTSQPPKSQSAASKSSWRKRDGRDHRIHRDVIPRGVLAGRIGKRFPRTSSNTTKGLSNIKGVSCYRNALLQCLIHTPDVYHLLGNIHKDCNRPARQCTMCVLQKVVQEYWNPHDDAEHSESQELLKLMREFRKALQTDISQSTSDPAPGDLIEEEVLNDQQCSSYDFWKGLLEILKDQVANDSAASALLSRAFDFKYHGTWTCTVCDKEHQDDQEQTEPGLDVNPFSLLPERGLNLIDYIDQATLSTKAAFRCESETCTTAREASPQQEPLEHTKRFRITKAPEVLVIRTQRLGYPIDEVTNLPVYRDGETEKFEDEIPYEEYLDLSDFSDDLEFSRLTYKLMGVVYHTGTGESGHYIAVARSRTDEGKFALCDDNNIYVPQDIDGFLNGVTLGVDDGDDSDDSDDGDDGQSLMPAAGSAYTGLRSGRSRIFLHYCFSLRFLFTPRSPNPVHHYMHINKEINLNKLFPQEWKFNLKMISLLKTKQFRIPFHHIAHSFEFSYGPFLSTGFIQDKPFSDPSSPSDSSSIFIASHPGLIIAPKKRKKSNPSNCNTNPPPWLPQDGSAALFPTPPSPQRRTPKPKAERSPQLHKRNGKIVRTNRQAIPTHPHTNLPKRRFPPVGSPTSKGLLNTSNDCYKLASLQAIFHVPAFYRYLGKIHKTCASKPNKCVLCALQDLLYQYWEKDDDKERKAKLRTFYAACRANLPVLTADLGGDFLRNQQADAYDFLHYLVTEQIGSKSSSESFRKMFEMGFESTRVCRTCGSVSTAPLAQASFMLEIPVNTSPDGWRSLNGCLQDFLGNGVQTYTCEECDGPDRNVTTLLTHASEILVLRLAISTFDGVTGNNTKILAEETEVYYPEILNLNQFVDHYQVTEDCVYRLDGVVAHSGKRTDRGHYVAMVREYNNLRDFCLVNDTLVTTDLAWANMRRPRLDCGFYIACFKTHLRPNRSFRLAFLSMWVVH